MKTLWGRQLLKTEIAPDLIEKGQKFPTLKKLDNDYQCVRCGQIFAKKLFSLPTGLGYCPFCFSLGRVLENEFFYFLPRPKINLLTKAIYPHSLSFGQEKKSQWISEVIDKKLPFALLWAVTGAGKTEMTFLGIEKVLNKGEQVAFCAPRIDVCLEIYPRLEKAFPNVSKVLLYGKTPEKYSGQALVVCTTHQLLRFKNAFSLIILDEVDAFPFSTEKILQFACFNARKKSGTIIMLTATPGEKQLSLMEKNKLPYKVLPGRFHGKELDVPQFLWCHWEETLLKRLPFKLKKHLKEKMWLIFCPTIVFMEKFLPVLEKTFPEKAITSVHAKDPFRIEKVKEIRQGKYDLILCTTILERGVTLIDIQVMVIGSNQGIFKKEVLVQISGRTGRSLKATSGKIIFVHHGKSQAMVKARKEIQALNKLAKKEGEWHDLS